MASLLTLLTGCGNGQNERLKDFYSIAEIPPPEGVFPEVGGLDVLPGGDLAVCFHRGEVMIFDVDSARWRLFAEGLHDPLGIMAVSENELLVMQRPELTRLTDTDGDGKADRYETVTDDFGLSGNYCEFGYGPVKDAAGNLYISLNTASNGAGIWDEQRGAFNPLGRPGRMYSAVPYRGWVMKLTPEGKLEPYAMGFRSPDGIGFDGKGNLFVTDNQGDWLGTSKMYHVEAGNFYGHASSLVWKAGWNRDPLKLPVPVLDSMRTREAIQFPHGIFANSPTQMLPIPEDSFGPYGGQLLVGEMNHPKLIRVMLEKVKGAFQGACINFLDSAGLTNGGHRLVFSPDGKSLYVGKTAYTWVGGKGIQKITYNGGTPMDILSMNLTREGFRLTFTRPLADTAGNSPEDYNFIRYYYEYHQKYGSDRMDLQPVRVTSVSVSRDRKEVSLELDNMTAGYLYELTADSLVSQKGLPLANRKVYYTLNNTL